MQLPTGFYTTLTKNVKTMTTATKQTDILGSAYVAHCECGIHLWTCYWNNGIIKREHIHGDTMLSWISTTPTALFDETGEIRKTSKSVLMTKIHVQCDTRSKKTPAVVILDGRAVFWAVPCIKSYCRTTHQKRNQPCLQAKGWDATSQTSCCSKC